ncbi:hypothetical protein [Granulicella sibirica]|uniref:Uncharacterized protein n=1 Tax=Granulicella sibirica TaxID=2479048 RepID=A0A4Q0SW95_9BACT|nr:hypothetical protein [Granulicella sibirica]RXH54180.1 hypothetical protein GRAN_4831 [Granulicella sibirica]
MSDNQPQGRPAIKLDFTTGLDKLPPRPKMDESTTLASVTAGRELGFSGRAEPAPSPAPSPFLDGRRLRSRGANTQLNLKVTAEEKDAILRDAARFIHDPGSPINNIGEFVVYAVDFLRSHGRRAE